MRTRSGLGRPDRNGFTLTEVILSFLLFAVLVITIHQSLSITFLAAEKAAARLRCTVTANNILERAMATSNSATFTLVLCSLLPGSKLGGTDWLEIPAAYSAKGMLGSVTGRIGTTSVKFAQDGSPEVATVVAVIEVRENIHDSQVSLQAFRDPLE